MADNHAVNRDMQNTLFHRNPNMNSRNPSQLIQVNQIAPLQPQHYYPLNLKYVNSRPNLFS